LLACAIPFASAGYSGVDAGLGRLGWGKNAEKRKAEAKRREGGRILGGVAKDNVLRLMKGEAS